MKSQLITTIPVYNGEAFIAETLASIARQTRRPDRVIVLDNGSTDRTETLVRAFKGFSCEFIRNPKNLGLFGNMNRCLDFATETDFLHILHADDTISPLFYAVMLPLLAEEKKFGLAWCLDERIDENGQSLSLSARPDESVVRLTKDDFLKQKAELGNQAICATLLKTSGQTVPVRFREDFPIMGDTAFWAAFGVHCQTLICLNRALAQYRWHGTNQTTALGVSIQALVLDEWQTMQINEALRGVAPSFLRTLKLKALFAVRSGIKAKRSAQNGQATYAQKITAAAKPITGFPIWFAGKMVVELRDFYLFKIQRRQRHPKNIYG